VNALHSGAARAATREELCALTAAQVGSLNA